MVSQTARNWVDLRVDQKVHQMADQLGQTAESLWALQTEQMSAVQKADLRVDQLEPSKVVR